MTDQAVIEHRISEVQRLLHELRAFGPITTTELLNDSKLRGAVQWHLFSITQLTIEIGDTIIAWKRFRKPGSYRETFDILAEQAVVDRELAMNLVKMTGLRNVLAHMYRRIDLGIVANAVMHRLGDIDEFLAVIQQKLTGS